MDDRNYVFYAFTVNDHDASIFVTPEEAIEELTMRMADDDEEEYGIEPVMGIWELTKRIGAFEDYGDYWMPDAIEIVADMIQKKRELMRQAEERKKEEQK